MSARDGGPAHDSGARFYGASGALCGETVDSSGVTVRDLFAMKAMAGMLSHPQVDYSPINDGLIKNVSSDAYKIADAMLIAREVQP